MSDGNPFKTPRKQLSMSSLPVASQSNAAGDEYTKQLEKMVDQYKKDFEGEYLSIIYLFSLSVSLSLKTDLHHKWSARLEDIDFPSNKE